MRLLTPAYFRRLKLGRSEGDMLDNLLKFEREASEIFPDKPLPLDAVDRAKRKMDLAEKKRHLENQRARLIRSRVNGWLDAHEVELWSAALTGFVLAGLLWWFRGLP